MGNPLEPRGELALQEPAEAVEVSATACWLRSWYGSMCCGTHLNTKDCGESKSLFTSTART